MCLQDDLAGFHIVYLELVQYSYDKDSVTVSEENSNSRQRDLKREI